jgi:hypothetical protein
VKSIAEFDAEGKNKKGYLWGILLGTAKKAGWTLALLSTNLHIIAVFV